jgi:hypothetical protein
MSHIKTLVSQVLVVVNLTIGRLPLTIRLFDLRRQPSVARVVITRRRQLDYAEFFSDADRDGRRAAPIHRTSEASAKDHYRWADTA